MLEILKLWLSIDNNDNCKEKNASSHKEEASFISYFYRFRIVREA